MPSREFQRELEGMGLHSEGLKECPKCHRQVEKWGKYTFNPEDHPTEPLALHLASCGSPEEEVVGLPPIPVQRVVEEPTQSQVINGHVYEVGMDKGIEEIRDAGWYKREYEKLMREKAGE